MRPAFRRNLRKVLAFATLWMVGGVIFALLERGILGFAKTYPSTNVAYDFTSNLVAITIVSFFAGALVIVLDILFINKKLIKKSFLKILFAKTFIFLVIIIFTILTAGIIATANTLNLPVFHADVLSGTVVFFNNFAFWSIIIYVGFITILSLFILEVSDNVGAGVFWSFFTGRYHTSEVEHRIFMFLDLEGSTTIAEQLGHVEYFKFLNRFFSDISDTVLKSWGTIYQYVGDELVVSWPASRGAESIRCFFGIREEIEYRREKYEKEYGFLPRFRAGIHGGPVSIGEIGTLKKDILFIGDVLNATSRIQGQCKTHNVNLLVSEEVIGPIRKELENEYQINDRGLADLRGKHERLRLFHVSKQDRIK